MELIWGYAPTQFDREITEEWTATRDTSFMATITIAEQSLVITATNGLSSEVRRQWDLAADLVEAAVRLRDRLT